MATGHVLFDDTGAPFIVFQDEQNEDRQSGIDALKVIFYLLFDLMVFFRIIFLLHVLLHL